MNQLFDPEQFTQAPAKEDPFPPGYFRGKARPGRNNEDIKRLVVEELLPDILQWFGDERDDEEVDEIRDQLLEVVSDGDDGYEMAKELDSNHGWDADSGLVEILDGISFYDIHKKACLAWIRDNDVKPRLAVGAQVKVKRRPWEKIMVEGEIAQIYDDGCYSVFIPSEGHVRSGPGTHGQIFDWEDVEALNPAA